ncbi:facilitated trehalose transporter Tret1-like [Anthonomus grandis grandis]|uniref:facilitated trehalose transporter Tret1-like n=1 Tax=Anthonomus grandis grandis TaxID=2921223 RepID=UPI0021651533|nr:facilitated trehalose transporter Tret1-like [Anthonomus grandis grandis]
MEGEDTRIRLDINADKRDNVTEVVYKPTTMDQRDIKWNKKFHSLEPESRAAVVPKDSFYLYRTAFLGNLLAFSAGTGFSWTSPVLPRLNGPGSPLGAPLDPTEISIIAAILCLGAAMGPFLFGYMADKVGRKITLMAIAAPMAAGAAILAFAWELWVFYFGRLLFGTGIGGVFTVLTMYTGEITSNHNRGKFSCLLGTFVALGVLYPFSIGSMLSIRIFSLSCLLPLQAFLIFFSIYAPESPTYLLRQGKKSLCQKTVMELRGISEEEARKALDELEQIESQNKEKGGIVVLFRTKNTRRAFMVAAGLLILQQFSGISAVLGFMEQIFSGAGGAIPPQLAATMVGVIQVFTVFVTSSVIEKLGRKFLLLSSTVGAAVSIILLGFYFFLHRQKLVLLAYLWWLPIASLIFYIVCFNMGLGPLPWTVLSEIFPDNVKSSAAAVASATCFMVSFVVTMAFPMINEMLGMAESFWLFGVCCVLGTVFIYFVVPETKGRSVQEIQEIFSK